LFDAETTVRDEQVGVVNHDEMGARWLRDRGFSARLAALVGGHVDAKRYLTATNPAYLQHLSPASQETLRLQGGPMAEEEAARFAASPDLKDMLRLRSWDEMAKDASWTGPREDYREMMIRHLTGSSSE
jgi:predicted HD phosphohydrolase